MLQREDRAVVVDPGDAQPVLEYLRAHHLTLDAVLITHHHADHIDGVADLLADYPAEVYAPSRGNYAFPHHAVREGDVIKLSGIQAHFQVLETPGHTLDHVVYYGANRLFCGDTLFACGCGRLFEGTCQQLYRSLQRLANLPPTTEVYCTHEYTLHNIRFARSLEMDNPVLDARYQQALQCIAEGRPTLPSTIGLELATNPFLRCENKALIQATGSDTPESVFCTLRELRNSF